MIGGHVRAFGSWRRFLEEVSATLGAPVGLGGLALQSEPVTLAGVGLIILAATLNEGRWAELGFLAVVAIAAEAIGRQLGVVSAGPVALIVLSAAVQAFMNITRAGQIEEESRKDPEGWGADGEGRGR